MRLTAVLIVTMLSGCFNPPTHEPQPAEPEAPRDPVSLIVARNRCEGETWVCSFDLVASEAGTLRIRRGDLWEQGDGVDVRVVPKGRSELRVEVSPEGDLLRVAFRGDSGRFALGLYPIETPPRP